MQKIHIFHEQHVCRCLFFGASFVSRGLSRTMSSYPYKVHLPANLQEEPTFMSITNLKRPINAFVICEKACPSNFVRDNEDCYVECPNDKKSMIYNMTCFQHCPDEYPFVIKENRRSICTNSCKKLHF